MVFSIQEKANLVSLYDAVKLAELILRHLFPQHIAVDDLHWAEDLQTDRFYT